MKPLSEALKITVDSSNPTAKDLSTPSTPQHGSTSGDGRLTTSQSLPVPLVDFPSRETRQQISFCVQLVESSQRTITRGKLIWDEKTKDDIFVVIPVRMETVMEPEQIQRSTEIMAYALRPMDKKLTAAALTRLMAHKRFNNMPENLVEIFIKDCCEELAHFSHHAILESLAEIKRDPSPWYPTMGKIIEMVSIKHQDLLRANSHLASSVTPDDYRRIEREEMDKPMSAYAGM